MTTSELLKTVVGDRTFEIRLDEDHVVIDGCSVPLDVEEIDQGSFLLNLDGKTYVVTVQEQDGVFQATHRKGQSEVLVLDHAAQLLEQVQADRHGISKAQKIKAPMPGLVLKLEVKEGDTIEKGQGLLVLEAMKMENEIFAAGGGVIQHVHVSEGEAVAKGELLVTVGPA